MQGIIATLVALNLVASSSCQFWGPPQIFNSWKVMGTNKVPVQHQQYHQVFRFVEFAPMFQRMEIVQQRQPMSGKLINQQMKQAPIESIQEQQVKVKPQPPTAPLAKRVGAPQKPAASPKANRPKVPAKHLKTLLPVGLTSWHLGGIRDLNGKHWHLPAEVVDRLTVNDVDLKVEKPAGSLGPSLIPR